MLILWELLWEHFIIMKITFKFRSRKRKQDGFSELLIRLRSGRQNDKIVCTGIYLNSKYWNRSENYVTEKHPNSIGYNDLIKEYKDRIYEGKHKFNKNQFSFQTLFKYLKGEAKFKSLDEYVETIIKDAKTDQNYKGYIDNLKRFKRLYGVNRTISFQDLSNDTYSIFELVHKKAQKLSMDETVRFSQTTYRQMIVHIGAICNHAHNKGYIREKINIPSEFKNVKGDTGAIKTHTKEEVLEWIKEINTIQQWETIGMWILMFCMRGLYQADIVKLSENMLKDTNKERRKRRISDYWRDNLYYYHPRSKTHEKMYIKLFRYPILNLLETMKNVVVYNRYPYRPNKIASINDKIAIYDYDPTSNKEEHQKVWQTQVRCMREKFGSCFKTARKSFATVVADKFPETINLVLLGRRISKEQGFKADKTLHQSYIDILSPKLMKRVEEAHLSVLKDFEIDKIYKALFDKLQALIKSQKHPQWILGHSGVLKEKKEYKIVVGTDKKTGKVKLENIGKKFAKYFKNDKTRTKDYWIDLEQAKKDAKDSLEKATNIEGKITKTGVKEIMIMSKKKDIEEREKDLMKALAEQGIASAVN